MPNPSTESPEDPIVRERAVPIGFSAVARALLDRVGVVEFFNERLRWDPVRTKLSPGQRLLALILGTLPGRPPLYKMDAFFERHSIAGIVVGKNVHPEDLNDDALARALDRLAEAEPARLFSALVAKMFATFQISYSALNGDTTSVLLHGEFPDAVDKPGVTPTYGYSKQHRPDKKQIVVGVTTAHGIPITANVLDGNTSDPAWNNLNLKALQKELPLETLRRVTYVADSKLVTPQNLALLDQAGIRFVSRLPDTYGLVGQLKRKALADGILEDKRPFVLARAADPKRAAQYRVRKYVDRLDGRIYAFVAVASSALAQGKEKTVRRRAEREGERLLASASQLGRARYACQKDAQTAYDRWLKKERVRFHAPSVRIVRSEVHESRAQRGRPPKDAPPQASHTVYALEITLGPVVEQAVTDQVRLEGMFVLITSRQELAARSVLREYKTQESVERAFKRINTPHWIGPIYLHTPARVMALTFVILLALVVASLTEHLVRRALTRRQEDLDIRWRRKGTKPTFEIIDELCLALNAWRIDYASGRVAYKFATPDPPVVHILALLGLTYEAVLIPPY
jgi:transposase